MKRNVNFRTVFVLALLAAGSGQYGCSNADRALREPGLRSQASSTDSSWVGVSVDDFLSGYQQYEGRLQWVGNAYSEFVATPAEGSALVNHALIPGDAPVFEVDPCPDGPGRSTGNVSPDCRPYVEFPATLRVDTDDGSLEESWPATVRLFAEDDWVVRARSDGFTGLFDARHAAPIEYTIVVEGNERDAEGVLVGEVSLSQSRGSDGTATGVATGFTAAVWGSQKL